MVPNVDSSNGKERAGSLERSIEDRKGKITRDMANLWRKFTKGSQETTSCDQEMHGK